MPIVHAVKALRSFTPFEGPYYRLPPFEGLYYLLITFIYHGVQCIHHAVHTRYIHTHFILIIVRYLRPVGWAGLRLRYD